MTSGSWRPRQSSVITKSNQSPSRHWNGASSTSDCNSNNDINASFTIGSCVGKRRNSSAPAPMPYRASRVRGPARNVRGSSPSSRANNYNRRCSAEAGVRRMVSSDRLPGRLSGLKGLRRVYQGVGSRPSRITRRFIQATVVGCMKCTGLRGRARKLRRCAGRTLLSSVGWCVPRTLQCY